MKRQARRSAFVLRLEVLEARSLLSGDSGGLWPLRDDPSNSLLVRFADIASPQAQATLNSLKAYVVQAFPDGPARVALGQGVDPSAAVRSLKSNPAVVYVELDSAAVHVTDVIPNDPQFGQQWGLSNPSGIDIDVSHAWDITTGTPSTVVAVIDSGIDLSHPEFAGRLWTNPNTHDAQPGDVHGWNFINNTNNLQDTDGHGTHVSGVIAADANNAIGVSGVAPNVQLMILKTIGARGDGTVDAAVSAIYFAADHGARVINASWAGPDSSQALADAIRYAGSKGVVFVSAAGNETANNDVIPSYPANIHLSNTISVAAVDRSGNLADFSNYGRTTVDLAAPGVDIRSTYIGGGYQTLSGTSMATPFVSGVVALVASLHPDWSAPQLVSRVMSTVTPLPSLAGKTVSGGMVSAAHAIHGSPNVSTVSTGGGFAQIGVSPPGPGSSPDVVRLAVLASDEFAASRGGMPAGFVNGLYLDLLARPASPGEVTNWVGLLQSGQSRGEVIAGIMGSAEARATKVARWYRDELRRPFSLDQLKADPGVIGWANLLGQGMSDNEVEASILASDESFSASGGTADRFINALYLNLLGRPAGAGEVAARLGLLQSGQSRLDEVRDIMGSAEARATKVARWYQSDLFRPGSLAQLKTDPGAIGWGNLLA